MSDSRAPLVGEQLAHLILHERPERVTEVQTPAQTWWTKHKATAVPVALATWGGLVGKWPSVIGVALLAAGCWLLVRRVKAIRQARRERLRRWAWATSHRASPRRSGLRRPAFFLALAAAAGIMVNVVVADDTGDGHVSVACELGFEDC
jgi:hypothetical protein